MQIKESNILMGAQSSGYSYYNISEKLRAWLGDKNVSVETAKSKTSTLDINSISSIFSKDDDNKGLFAVSAKIPFDLSSKYGNNLNNASDSIKQTVRNFDKMLKNYDKIRQATDSLNQSKSLVNGGSDKFSVSGSLAKLMERFRKNASTTAVDGAKKSSGDETFDTRLDSKERIAKYLLETLTGFKFNMKFYDNAEKQQEQKSAKQVETATERNQTAELTDNSPQNWGLEYSRKVTQYESEQFKFSANGTIKTQDGQEINFTLKYELSREYFSESTESLRAGDAALKDPIVINFGGNAAQLSDTYFKFDLENDGSLKNIPYLQPGSGYLFFDKNDTGNISQSQLVGALSGNGFAELSALDADKNGWLDKSDTAFDKLKVLSKTEEGNVKYETLMQKNIAAVYLNSQNAVFNYKNSSNNLLARQVSAGIYLNVNGSAGSVQQLNLKV